ncbi:MAG TPA: dephospho-CoA kinase [Candidatus Sulfotelmatobacter sp.]|nr:dephospho-CoA kinase [Candidatus Sulfotelmatobacter sp.]
MPWENMLKIGLTGGIASGKSVVGKMLVALGAYLVEADHIAHSLMQPGEAVYNEVVRRFGREILNPDGTVNRAKLAEVAFGAGSSGERQSRIEELNRIVHPAVLRSQDEWMQAMGLQDPHAVAIVEAALILEAGAGDRFDRLIVVTCDPEQRASRFAARQKIDVETARKEVARRMAAQLPEEAKIKAADYVIDNSGSLEDTREQVQNVWQKLQAELEES